MVYDPFCTAIGIPLATGLVKKKRPNGLLIKKFIIFAMSLAARTNIMRCY